MKRVIAVGVLPALAAGQAGNSGVGRVVQMLKTVKATCEEEAHKEEVMYTKYKQASYVHDLTEKKEDLKAAKAEIERLTAEYDAHTAAAEKLDASVVAREEAVTEMQGKLAEALTARTEENGLFKTNEQDLTETVAACNEVLTTLTGDARGLALAQATKTMSPKAQEMYTNLMTQTPEGDAYRAKSGGVIELVKELQKKFKTELAEAQEEEAEALHAYNTLKTDLDASIALQTKLITDEKATSGLKKAAAGAADTSRTQEMKKAEDLTELVANIEKECATKAEEMAERGKLRSDEIAAIDQAIEIVSGVKQVTAAPTAVNPITGDSFVQIRSSYRNTASVVNEAIDFLAAEGNDMDSSTLKTAAISLVDMTTTGHLDEVIKVLSDYKAKLAAAKDAYAMDHYCRTSTDLNLKELAFSKANKEDLEKETAALQATVDECKEKIDGNDKSIKETYAAVKSASEMRAERKAAHQLTIAEATEASEACDQALKVLGDFYESANQASDLAGTEVTASNNAMAASYTGSTAQEGLLGLLRQVSHDFVEESNSADRSERDEASMHSEYLDESGREIKQLETINATLKNKKANAAKDLAQYTDELETETEKYESCVSMKQTLYDECDYEGKKQQRLKKEREDKQARELAALEKALEILNKYK
jgi:hypothetical protein